MTLSDRIRQLAHDWRFHAATVVSFLAVEALGYRYAGGLDFVQGWGGGVAAVIATFFLVFKSQGYWAWMMVNAGLWCALFFHTGLPMLGWLQVAFLIYAAYGMIQWALVKYRIGWNPKVPADLVGATLAFALVGVAIYVYRDMEGYALTGYWWLEVGATTTAILAMALDAFRYKANWIAWTASNCFFIFVAFHYDLWGPFVTTFIYQAINVVGWFEWVRDERRLRELERVGAGGTYAFEKAIREGRLTHDSDPNRSANLIPSGTIGTARRGR